MEGEEILGIHFYYYFLIAIGVGNRKFLLHAVRELHRKSEYCILGLNIFKKETNIWLVPNIKG